MKNAFAAAFAQGVTTNGTPLKIIGTGAFRFILQIISLMIMLGVKPMRITVCKTLEEKYEAYCDEIDKLDDTTAPGTTWKFLKKHIEFTGRPTDLFKLGKGRTPVMNCIFPTDDNPRAQVAVKAVPGFFLKGVPLYDDENITIVREIYLYAVGIIPYKLLPIKCIHIREDNKGLACPGLMFEKMKCDLEKLYDRVNGKISFNPAVVRDFVYYDSKGDKLESILNEASPRNGTNIRNLEVISGLVLYIIDQLVEWLIAAKALGMIHSDIKDKNFIISEDGTIYSIDMGLALLTDDAAEKVTTMIEEKLKTITDIPFSMSQAVIPAYDLEDYCAPKTLWTLLTRKVGSTPSFRAPEHFDLEEYNTRTNTYQLAVVLLYMIIPCLRFMQFDPNRCTDLPEDYMLEKWLDVCMAQPGRIRSLLDGLLPDSKYRELKDIILDSLIEDPVCRLSTDVMTMRLEQAMWKIKVHSPEEFMEIVNDGLFIDASSIRPPTFREHGHQIPPPPNWAIEEPPKPKPQLGFLSRMVSSVSSMLTGN